MCQEQEVPVVKQFYVSHQDEHDVQRRHEDDEDKLEYTAGLEKHCTADHGQQHTERHVLKIDSNSYI